MPIIFAPAKINLSLKIIGMRQDGFHLLEMENTFVNFGDTIYLDIDDSKKDSISMQGLSEEKLSTWGNNIASKSVDWFRGRFNKEFYCQIEIQKKIPIGAGLGGGSGNAAAVLKYLSTHFNIMLNPSELVELGGDVPSCFVGGWQKVTGVGEGVQTVVKPDISEEVTIILPDFGCSTPAVYNTYRHLPLIQKELSRTYHNHLEVAAVECYPILGEILLELRKIHSDVRLLGSGSSILLLGKIDNINDLNQISSNYNLKTVQTSWYR